MAVAIEAGLLSGFNAERGYQAQGASMIRDYEKCVLGMFECSVADRVADYHTCPDADALRVATLSQYCIAMNNEGVQMARYGVHWEYAPQRYTDVLVTDVMSVPVGEFIGSAESLDSGTDQAHTASFGKHYSRNEQEANYQPQLELPATRAECMPTTYAQELQHNLYIQQLQQAQQVQFPLQTSFIPLVLSGFVPVVINTPPVYYQSVAAPAFPSAPLEVPPAASNTKLDGEMTADNWEDMAKSCAVYAEKLRKTQRGAGEWRKTHKIASIMRQYGISEARVPEDSGVGVGCGGATEQSPRLNSESCETQVAKDTVLNVDRTTVVLRHLPVDYEYQDLLNLLNQHGFDAKYDFVYFPMDFNGAVEKGFGYAFINLTSHAFALLFRKVFANFTDASVGLDKALDVQWSFPFQGRDANVKRYTNSPVMHEVVPRCRQPHIFENGIEIKFPSPTQPIRPPRRMIPSVLNSRKTKEQRQSSALMPGRESGKGERVGT